MIQKDRRAVQAKGDHSGHWINAMCDIGWSLDEEKNCSGTIEKIWISFWRLDNKVITVLISWLWSLYYEDVIC